jgi:hypothetical protein
MEAIIISAIIALIKNSVPWNKPAYILNKAANSNKEKGPYNHSYLAL